MRRIALIFSTVAAGAALAAGVAGADDESHTYKLEMFNAFGLVDGAEVKVAGVTAGTIAGLDISEDKTALVTVELVGPLAVLGDETECSSEPQSLIAEYFVDCLPAGDPLPEGAIVPTKVKQTVQNDLVLNTLRMPFKQRLALLINEFGTALAGNPENLNEAVRLGAPALEDLHEALKLLAGQNKVIAQLNADSDEIVGKLNDRSDDVVRFVQTAGDTAAASAERRDDLSTNFDLLDDFLAELEPTMVELENVARESTPLLADLRLAAPGLNELALDLPAFNEATEASLVTLGRAAGPGRRALARGERNGVFRALADAGRKGPRATELVADLLSDLDDPRRAVEVDDRAARSCDDDTLPCFSTGREGPTGYTGLEGLLNYAYYQAGAINQYDSVGHLLHFSLYDVFQGPCGEYNAQQSYPARPGLGDAEGRTTNVLEADECVGGLGPNQPGVNESEESLGVGPYHPSVCPEGSTDLSICDPDGPARGSAGATASRQRGGEGTGGAPDGPGSGLPALPDLPNELPGAGDIRDQLDDLLDLPDSGLGLGGRDDDRDRGKGGRGGAGKAAEDLLDFLFAP